jgi:mannose-1-phosphate guanylyltransferase/mannose-6-phosphate isomerase
VATSLQSQGLLEKTSIILEPFSRNTAPAIALAAHSALKISSEAILLVMPADHVISDPVALSKAVLSGEVVASQGKLVTFGVKPKTAHTGFGYIQAQGLHNSGYCDVETFIEKPDLEKAEQYVKDGGYYWNSGMFMFRADRILEELDVFSADIVQCSRNAMAAACLDMDFIRVDGEAFALSPDISIDYALMEKTSNAVVIPLDAGWNDVGSWEALWNISDKDADGNVCIGDVITEDVCGSYIHSGGRLIAAIGLENHVIVETDDAVLVANKSRVQDVKVLVERLKILGRAEHEYHRKVHRPWGTFERLAANERFQVKRIIVKPGARLSLQKHHYRAEHWVVVSGTAVVTRGEEEILLTSDQSTYIPLEVMHRLVNPGDVPLEIIEVQTGSYLGEDDIVRFDDNYGRS